VSIYRRRVLVPVVVFRGIDCLFRYVGYDVGYRICLTGPSRVSDFSTGC
jgi:hypothetical protein